MISRSDLFTQLPWLHSELAQRGIASRSDVQAAKNALESVADDSRARIEVLESTTATEDFAEAKKTEAIEAAVAQSVASFTSTLTAYATKEFASVLSEKAISASVEASTATFRETLTAYASKEFAQVIKEEAISAAVTEAEASFSSALTLYATQTFAEAKKTEAISAAAADATAKVTTEAVARAAVDGSIQAQWAVRIDGNGRMIGRIRIAGTDATSVVEFTTDSVKVSHPSYPGVVFNTTSRSSASTDGHSFGTGGGFGFSHATPAVLYGPGHGAAPGATDSIAMVRSGRINVLCLGRIAGYSGPLTIYYRVNGGAFIALAGVNAVADVPVVASRGVGFFSGLAPTDSFSFYVAPCTGSGDIASAPAATRAEIDVFAFNW